MEAKFPFINSQDFIQVNSYRRAFALFALFASAFALTFMVIPFQEWKMHFYQVGIFGAGFVFGPIAGATVGALASSYNAMFVLHNPWIIGGNALLGFFAAYFYLRFGAFKAVLMAYAIQIPYLYFTDVYLAGMPIMAVHGIALTLLATNLVSVLAAGWIAPQITRRL